MSPPRLLIALLIAAYWSLDMAAEARARFDGDPRLGLVLLSLVLSQISLAALWTAFGRTSKVLRGLAAVAACLFATRLLYASVPDAGKWVVLQFALGYSLGLALRFVGFRNVCPGSAEETGCGRPLSLGALLALLTNWSIAAAVANPAALSSDQMPALYLLGTVPLTVLVAMFVMLATRSNLVAAVLSSLACGAAAALMFYMLGAPSALAVTGLVCGASCWVVRCCGLRMRWPGESIAVSELPPDAGISPLMLYTGVPAALFENAPFENA